MLLREEIDDYWSSLVRTRWVRQHREAARRWVAQKRPENVILNPLHPGQEWIQVGSAAENEEKLRADVQALESLEFWKGFRGVIPKRPDWVAYRQGSPPTHLKAILRILGFVSIILALLGGAASVVIY
jgi:hypothetical protein